ncbi:MAG: hypothetical protein KDI92_07055 [Xanthomonadales bacterium]|nr:hypothetical protein [Xanthomonadales bacterium]
MKNTTSRKLRFITLLLSAALLTSLLIWQQSRSHIIKKQSNQPVTLTSTTLQAGRMLKLTSQHQFVRADLQQAIQVNSLQGSQPDGAINFDEQGNVKADKDLHRLFDYYLSTQGEQDMVQIKKQLLMSASDYLSLNQLEQLRDYFDQYVQYLENAENFAVSFNDDEPLEQRLIQIKQLREDLLGQQMADGFFADEYAYAEWVLQQDNIPDNELNEQQIKWLEAENKATAYQDALIQNQKFETVGLSELEKQAARTETYGEQVANQLAALDKQQSLWNEKVQSYIGLREQIKNHTELKNLHSQYSNSELKRLNAYWRQHISES